MCTLRLSKISFPLITHTVILVAISNITPAFLSNSSWNEFQIFYHAAIKPQLQSLNVFSKKWAIRFLQAPPSALPVSEWTDWRGSDISDRTDDLLLFKNSIWWRETRGMNLSLRKSRGYSDRKLQPAVLADV